MGHIGRAVVLVTLLGAMQDARGGAKATGELNTVVAVVPVVPEQEGAGSWLAEAIASGLVPRLMDMGFAVMTLRQVEAARDQVELSYERIDDPVRATRLGRQLGTTKLVVVQAWGVVEGSGSLRVEAAIIDTRGGPLEPPPSQAEATKTVEGRTNNLSGVVDQIAKAVAKRLARGATKTAAPKPTPARAVQAWEHVVLAQRLLRGQSLSPRSADPNVPLEISSNEVAEALAHAERAAHYAPKDPEVAALLALAQELSSAADKADASLARARKLGGADLPTYVMNHAFVAMRRGQFDKAEALFAEAVRKRPGFLHARGSLGHLLNHFGRFREALAVFRGYVELVPRQPWALSQVGYTQSRLGRHKDAIAQTKAAIELQPQSPYLYVELASRHIDARDLDSALAATAYAVALRPDYARAYVRKCFICLLQEQDAEAIVACEMAVRLRGATRRDLAYAYLNLARAYGHQGRTEQSVNALSRAVALGVPSLIPVEEDPKLAALRKHPAFVKALGQ